MAAVLCGPAETAERGTVTPKATIGTANSEPNSAHCTTDPGLSHTEDREHAEGGEGHAGMEFEMPTLAEILEVESELLPDPQPNVNAHVNPSAILPHTAQ